MQYLDRIGLGTAWTRIKSWVKSYVFQATADRAVRIPYGTTDSTSTSTVFTATVDGIPVYDAENPTTLANGTHVFIKNTKVTSAAASTDPKCWTLNVNGYGAKKVYVTTADATYATTQFTVNYKYLFVYDSSLDSNNGGWYICQLYDSNTNTIGYQIRTYSTTRKTTDACRYYKVFFSSADGTHWVPAAASTSNSATSAKTVNQRPIDPFGPIVYYSTTTSFSAGSNVSASYVWQQYNLTFGYSFNRTGAALTLTTQEPVYIKCAPQADGSAIIDKDNPFVQELPDEEDGKIYIFFGVASAATTVELNIAHPIYYVTGSTENNNRKVRIWTNPAVASAEVQKYNSDKTDESVGTADYGQTDVVINGDVSTIVTTQAPPSAVRQYIAPSWRALNQKLAEKADADAIPTKTSDLTNDSGFITSHQDISGKADKANQGIADEPLAEQHRSTYDATIATNIKIDTNSGSQSANVVQHDMVTGSITGTINTDKAKIPTSAAVAKYVGDIAANKQDTISDLATIRSGASAGATAIQPEDIKDELDPGGDGEIADSAAIADYVEDAISDKVDKVASTDNAIVRFNGTAGAIQNSGVTIDDSNNITAAKFVKSGGTASQFLKADGSVDTTSYATAASDNNKVPYGGVLMPTNPFGGKTLYVNSLDNAFSSADQKYYVTVTKHNKSVNGVTYPYVDSTKDATADDYYVDSPIVSTYSTSVAHRLFDGNYESNITCSANEYIRIRIMFGENTSPSATTSYFLGYPYGTYYLSYYYNLIPNTASQCRVYNKFPTHGIGWHLYTATAFNGSLNNASLIERFIDNADYTRSCVDFIIFGNSVSGRNVGISQIDYQLSRPNIGRDGSTVTKYDPQSLYHTFKWYNEHEETVSINNNGEVTATKFKKSGGTSSQFLKADGSVDSNTYLTDSSIVDSNTVFGEHSKAPSGYAVSAEFARKSDLTAKYEKPSNGIPKSDLDSSVQTSLGKADSAVQSVTVSQSSAVGTGGTTIQVNNSNAYQVVSDGEPQGSDNGYVAPTWGAMKTLLGGKVDSVELVKHKTDELDETYDTCQTDLFVDDVSLGTIVATSKPVTSQRPYVAPSWQGFEEKLSQKSDKSNTYTKSEVDGLVSGINNNVIIGELPTTGQLQNRIYRVPGTNSYTDWAWDGSDWVKLAEFSGSIFMQLTEAQYDALSDTEKNNGTWYFIEEE